MVTYLPEGNQNDGEATLTDMDDINLYQLISKPIKVKSMCIIVAMLSKSV